MKQQQLNGYTPKYPKKLIRGAALAMSAIIALGGSGACRRTPTDTAGLVPIDDPQIDGEIMVDEPTEEPQLEGIVAPEETPESSPLPTGLLLLPTPEPEEPEWMGDVVADPTEP